MPTPVALFSRDLGGAGNPPLVLLHGLLGSSRNWQTAGRDLASRYHVHALDLRNHGRSPHAPEAGYAAMLADVIAWLDAARLARVTLLGHSLGGKVAMLAACRHAARVERLIVVDIAPKDYQWAAHRAEFAAMHELDLAHLRSRAEAELRFEARVDDWAMRKFLATNLESDSTGGWRWQINLPALSAALPELERNVLQPEDRYPGRALFVTGGRSQYVLPEDHDRIREHFPAARIVTLPTAGHNAHMETRAEFVQAVFAAEA
jgi:pimeloyl-ACP methyl ester carboxylesterase